MIRFYFADGLTHADVPIPDGQTSEGVLHNVTTTIQRGGGAIHMSGFVIPTAKILYVVVRA